MARQHQACPVAIGSQHNMAGRVRRVGDWPFAPMSLKHLFHGEVSWFESHSFPIPRLSTLLQAPSLDIIDIIDILLLYNLRNSSFV